MNVLFIYFFLLYKAKNVKQISNLRTVNFICKWLTTPIGL